MEPIKIAFVGTGFAAKIHATAYKQIPNVDVKIVAVSSRKKENVKKFCEEMKIGPELITTDSFDMIRSMNADIIDICTPTHTHSEYAIEAAKAGKNIICEKPLTGFFGDTSIPVEDRQDVGNVDKLIMLEEVLKECEKIKQVIEKHQVIFGYAENWVYAPPISKIKSLLQAARGKILEIRCGESHSGSHSKFAAEWKYTGGGALIRMGSHPIGASLHLKQWEGIIRDGHPILPHSIIATTTKNRELLDNLPPEQDCIQSRPKDVEDWSTGILKFEDNTTAVIVASDVTLGGIENWLNIYGSNTRIEAKISNNNTVMAYAPTEKQFKDAYTIEKAETQAGWSYAQPSEDWMTGYPFEMADFVRSVIVKTQPLSNLDLAINTTKVIYAAYLSSESGKRIHIPKNFTYS
ncbi:MAG: Gfo/Idh/MocA family oxidoreductase [Candidatus Lokiarchaeota archaeon]|nr:Gfo/Idh/MocA family oxidoreductase [Candidatus Lokiarchaeota archaeon]